MLRKESGVSAEEVLPQEEVLPEESRMPRKEGMLPEESLLPREGYLPEEGLRILPVALPAHPVLSLPGERFLLSGIQITRKYCQKDRKNAF